MKAITLGLAVLIILTGFAVANNNCIPNIHSNEFYGTVYVNNNPLTGGNYTIVAMINDEIVGAQRIQNDGTYSIDVSPCPAVTSGKINFFVGDAEAKESGKYNYDPSGALGIFSNISLTKYPNSVCGNGEINKGEECDDENITNGDGCSEFCEIELGYNCQYSGDRSVCTRTCGNGVCDNGETCGTCSSDCGTCASSSSSSSSSSSGGGGGGGGGGSSSSSSSGGSVITKSSNTSTESTNPISIENLNNPEEKTISTSFFTAAVTGVSDFAKTGAGKGVMIGVLIIGGTVAFFALRKGGKSGKKKDTKKEAKK
jgi:cysteine-rich repeat protein